MADDRMKNDDLNKNMGGQQGQPGQPGQQGQQGQQAPGRNPDDQQFGQQKGTGQAPGKSGLEDDELGQGGGGRGGQQGGGQNPGGTQNR